MNDKNVFDWLIDWLNNEVMGSRLFPLVNIGVVEAACILSQNVSFNYYIFMRAQIF